MTHGLDWGTMLQALIWFSCTYGAGVLLVVAYVPRHERADHLYWGTGMYLAVIVLGFVLQMAGWI